MAAAPVLDLPTLLILEEELQGRLKALATYGTGDGCPTCHNGELRAFLARVQRLRLIAEAQVARATPPPSPVRS